MKTLTKLVLGSLLLLPFLAFGQSALKPEEVAVMKDAFGRVRTADPSTVFAQHGFHYDIATNVWQSITNTTAASIVVSNSDASITLATGGPSTNLDSAARVTYEYFRYQPGKSHLVLLTGILGTQPSNVVSQIGYGDAENGVFFENWGGTNSVVLRSKASGTVVERRLAEPTWGGGVDLDESKVNIFGFDLEWLGAGRVRFYLVHNGEFRQVAAFNNDNLFTSVYMASGSLPITYKISKLATNAAGGTMKQICSTVISEGGYDWITGVSRSVGTAAAGVSVTNTAMALLGVRPALTLAGRTNRARIRLTEVSASVSSAPCRLRLVYRPTAVSGAVWTNNLGALDYDRINGKVVTNGTVVAQWEVTTATPVIRNADTLRRDLLLYPLVLDYNGLNPAELWLVGEAVSGTPVVTADMTWVEEY